MIYSTAQEALTSDHSGGRTLSTLEEALKLAGQEARSVNGITGYYSTPVKCVKGYSVGVVHGCEGCVDGIGRPIVEGLLADRDEMAEKYKSIIEQERGCK